MNLFSGAVDVCPAGKSYPPQLFSLPEWRKSYWQQHIHDPCQMQLWNGFVDSSWTLSATVCLRVSSYLFYPLIHRSLCALRLARELAPRVCFLPTLAAWMPSSALLSSKRQTCCLFTLPFTPSESRNFTFSKGPWGCFLSKVVCISMLAFQ